MVVLLEGLTFQDLIRGTPAIHYVFDHHSGVDREDDYAPTI